MAGKDCDECGAQGSVFERPEVDRFKYGKPIEVELVAVVPVWRCAKCKASYTDGTAEPIRAEAVRDYLDRKPVVSLGQVLYCLWVPSRPATDDLGLYEEYASLPLVLAAVKGLLKVEGQDLFISRRAL